MSEQQWAKAVMKSQHASAQKVRLVADSVRGVSVESALEQLAYHPSKHAALVKKTLESAMANAENNYALDIDELIVQSIFVDKATTLKRMRARARGRSARIFKHYCHITVVVGLEKGKVS